MRRSRRLAITPVLDPVLDQLHGNAGYAICSPHMWNWTPGQAKLRVWTKAESTFGGVNYLGDLRARQLTITNLLHNH